MIKSNSSLNKLDGSLSRNKKAFKIEFNDPYLAGKRIAVGQKYKQIEFETSNYNVIFEYIWLLRYSPPKYTGDIDFFYTKGYSKKSRYYYRLICPLTVKLNFHYQIDEIIYASDLLTWSRFATKAIIGGDGFITYVFANEASTQHYFAIECEVKMNYETFSDKAFALKNAIGYLTGYLVGDGGYFFAYSKKDMKKISQYYYCSFRDTIISNYNPININPYSLLHHKRNIADRLYKKKILRTITVQQLSNLADKLYHSLEFTSAIILLLESSVASLLFMPGGYAIVLETLSDLIIGNDKLNLAPIKERSKSKALRKKIIKVLDEECVGLPADDFAVLKIRIEQINQITNGERLKAPFKKLGIKLLEKDIEVLKSRNDFLHGRIPDLSKKIGYPNLDTKNSDLYYASLRFYTLLSILILKWIGFDNYVINYSKLSQDYTKIKLKEQYFRKV